MLGGLNNIRMRGGGFRLQERGRVNRLRVRSHHQGRTGTLTLGGDGGRGSPFILDYRWSGLGKQGEFRLLPLGGADAGWLELEAGRASGQQVLRIWAGPDGEHPARGEVRQRQRQVLPACQPGRAAYSAPINELVAAERGPDGQVSLCARPRVAKSSEGGR